MLSVGAIWSGAQVSSLDGKLACFLTRPDIRQECSVQTLTEVVTLSDGRQITVTTTQQDGESVADFIARHNVTVNALKQD